MKAFLARFASVLVVASFLLLSPASPCRASGTDDIVAVSAKASSDYSRERLENGTLALESYAFGKGGVWTGSNADASIDKLTFLDVAHAVAYPLADQNYLPASDPRAAKLLIMVYWGTTRAPVRAQDSAMNTFLQNAKDQLTIASMAVRVDESGNGPLFFQRRMELTTALDSVEMEKDQREKVDAANADMLGYDSWWERTARFQYTGFGLDYSRQDMFDELENNRYFVVLMAYDFQLLYKERKHKLLWETRFSIRQMHHEFAEDLPAMAHYASQYFGRDSKGLIHGDVPLGRVDVGAVQSLGTIPVK